MNKIDTIDSILEELMITVADLAVSRQPGSFLAKHKAKAALKQLMQPPCDHTRDAVGSCVKCGDREPPHSGTSDQSSQLELDDIFEDLIVGHNFEYARRAIEKWAEQRELSGAIQNLHYCLSYGIISSKDGVRKAKRQIEILTAERTTGEEPS